MNFDFFDVLGVRGAPGGSPIDGGCKNIPGVLFSDFLERLEVGSDPFFICFINVLKFLYVFCDLDIKSAKTANAVTCALQNWYVHLPAWSREVG